MSASPSGPVKGTRTRLEHIDAMRPVKQAAVISTHTLVFFAPLATSTAVTGLLVLSRFSRDAFFFVSACMLAFSYRDTKQMNLRSYFSRRFVSVGWPYLVWTVIYYLFTSASPVGVFPFYTFTGSAVFTTTGLHRFTHLLWTGYFHLYFLIVIMEFYVLFPLLLRFIRRHPRWHVQIFVAAVVWQLAYGVLVSMPAVTRYLGGALQTRLVFSYPIYLVGGVVVAMHLDTVHDWFVSHARSILAFTLASAALGEWLNYAGRYSWLPVALHTGGYVFSPMAVPYNVGAIISVYLLGVFLVSPRRSVRLRAMVQSGSDNSYGVYLSQMLWIPILLRIRVAYLPHLSWAIVTPVALVIVYALGFFFSALVARTPLARAVTGRSWATWASLWPGRVEDEVLRGDIGEGPLEVVEG